MANGQRKILVIEDEAVTRTLLTRRLESAGYQVFAPVSEPEPGQFQESVLEVARSENIHIAICDLTLPGEDGNTSVLTGLAVIRAIRALKKGTYVLVYSGTVDSKSMQRLKSVGVTESFSKDLEEGLDDLLSAVSEYAEKPRMVRRKD